MYARLFFLMLSGLFLWQAAFAQAQAGIAVVQAQASGEIPQDAIRLRILAHSDRLEDQWVKQQVKDEVVLLIEELVGQLSSRQRAEEVIAARIPQVEQLANRVLQANGFSYEAKVDFGMVPFPTKIYGATVYPAGEYEALRITLGDGLGANWWCVLFPPLCFIDLSNGDAVGAQEVSSGPAADIGEDGNQAQEQRQIQVKFFLLEVLKAWFSRG